MSLIHRRKSAIFNNPQLTLPQLRIQQLIMAKKQKFNMINQSKSKQKPINRQKLLLQQAITIQNLHQTMNKAFLAKGTISVAQFKEKNKGVSLYNLLRGFDRNCEEGICEQVDDIDKNKIDLFRSGKYYRSVDRAKGVGVKPINNDELQQYFCCEDSMHSMQSNRKNTSQQQKQSSNKKHASTSQFSRKSKKIKIKF